MELPGRSALQSHFQKDLWMRALEYELAAVVQGSK